MENNAIRMLRTGVDQLPPQAEADTKAGRKEKDLETFRLLNSVNTEALLLLKKGQLKLVESSRNMYLGRWERIELDKTQFLQTASKEALAPMSIEVIKACCDMSDHVHYHNDSYALITILGEDEGYPEPVNCKMFFKSKQPIPAASGITLQVAPGVMHSFSDGETPITFLSVQSKKIDEDYHFVHDRHGPN
jgi:hypothetical protein